VLEILASLGLLRKKYRGEVLVSQVRYYYEPRLESQEEFFLL